MNDGKYQLHFLHSRVGRSLLACVLVGTIGFPLLAADKPPIEPRADELLKRMSDYLGQAPFYSVSVEIWQDVDNSEGERLQAGRTAEIQVRRPDRLHATVHSARRNRELIYDGKDLTLFNHVDNLYGTVHTSSSLDETLDIASEKFGITVPLEDFVHSNPRKGLVQNATGGRDVGTVNVLGTPCEHLAFTQTNIDWQVWIEDGPRPVPRKFVITYKDEPNSPQFTAIFSDWDFNTKLPDFVFHFDPPPGAAKIKVKELKAEMETHK